MTSRCTGDVGLSWGKWWVLAGLKCHPFSIWNIRKWILFLLPWQQMLCVCLIPAHLIFFVSSMQMVQAKGGPCLRAAPKWLLARTGWVKWRKIKASGRHILKLRSTLLQNTFHSKLQKLKCFGHLKLNLTKTCVHTVGINFELSQLWTRWPSWYLPYVAVVLCGML